MLRHTKEKLLTGKHKQGLGSFGVQSRGNRAAPGFPVHFFKWADDENPRGESSDQNENRNSKGGEVGPSFLHGESRQGRTDTGEVPETILQAGPLPCGLWSGEGLRIGE